MKKKILILLTSVVFLLAGCGKSDDENADSAAETGVSGSDSTPENEDEKAGEADEENAGESGEVTEEAAPEYSFDVQNEYFGASFKSVEESDGSATMTFEFVNISGEVFYKNDEEIKPGESWEKIITQPKSKWISSAENGTGYWIHYNFFDKNSNSLFDGGIQFKTDKDLKITEMNIFTE